MVFLDYFQRRATSARRSSLCPYSGIVIISRFTGALSAQSQPAGICTGAQEVLVASERFYLAKRFIFTRAKMEPT